VLYILCSTAYILCSTTYIICSTAYIICSMVYILCSTAYIICSMVYILCYMPYFIRLCFNGYLAKMMSHDFLTKTCLFLVTCMYFFYPVAVFKPIRITKFHYFNMPKSLKCADNESIECGSVITIK